MRGYLKVNFSFPYNHNEYVGGANDYTYHPAISTHVISYVLTSSNDNGLVFIFVSKLWYRSENYKMKLFNRF